jgi:hypothetical protein
MEKVPLCVGARHLPFTPQLLPLNFYSLRKTAGGGPLARCRPRSAAKNNPERCPFGQNAGSLSLAAGSSCFS